MIKDAFKRDINFIIKLFIDKERKNIEKYINKHSLNISPEYFTECIFQADPSSDKKFAFYIYNQLKTNNISFADVENSDNNIIYNTLNELNRYLNRMNVVNDVFYQKIENSYITFNNIYKLTNKYRLIFHNVKSNQQLNSIEADMIINNTLFITKDINNLIISPLSKTACCFWGSGTLWDISLNNEKESDIHKNYFYDINQYGNIIICIQNGSKYLFIKDKEPVDIYNEPLNNISEPTLRNLAIINNSYDSITKPNWNNEKECEFIINNCPNAIDDMLKNINNKDRLSLLIYLANNHQDLVHNHNINKIFYSYANHYNYIKEDIVKKINEYNECFLKSENKVELSI